MEFSAKMIAEYINGTISGNPDITINTASKIEEAKQGSLAFLANPKYSKYLYTTQASIVIINEDFVLEKEVGCTLITVKDAYSAFASLLRLYEEQTKKQKKGIMKKAFISKSAKTGKDVYIAQYACIGEGAVIGDNVKIYPNAVIGDNVTIGEGSIIYANATVYDGSVIGKNCIIHSGVVVGSDGFGFAPDDQGVYKKIPQTGNVIIEDNVEIGSNTTIDRATMGSTIIRKGVKIDNLVQIAHNVELGENTIVIAQAGIAGSTKVGKNCIVAAQAGIVGHLVIGDNVTVGAQSGVAANVEEGASMFGSPAVPANDMKRIIIAMRRLPELLKKVRELERANEKKEEE